MDRVRATSPTCIPPTKSCGDARHGEPQGNDAAIAPAHLRQLDPLQPKQRLEFDVELRREEDIALLVADLGCAHSAHMQASEHGDRHTRMARRMLMTSRHACIVTRTARTLVV